MTGISSLLSQEPVEAMKYTVANLNDVKDNPEYGVDNTEEAMAWLEKKFGWPAEGIQGIKIQNLLDKEYCPISAQTNP